MDVANTSSSLLLQDVEKLNISTWLMNQTPSQDNVCFRTLNHTWAYRDVNQTVDIIAANLLIKRKLTPGDTVVLLSPCSIAQTLCWLAVVRAGGIITTVNPASSSVEFASIIELASPGLIIIDDALREKHIPDENHPLFSKMISIHSERENNAFISAAMLEPVPASFYWPESHAADIALMAFTSGSTGKPKMTFHSHGDIKANCESYVINTLAPQPSDIIVCTAPLSFNYGLGSLIFAPMTAGASAVLLNEVTPKTLPEIIQRFQATVLFTAPTAYRRLLKAGWPTSTLRKCISAGETLPEDLARQWHAATGLVLTDALGCTEALHIFISTREDETRPGWTGKALPGYEVAVLDESGQHLPPGMPGYLAVRGAIAERALAKSGPFAGWLITGDRAEQNNDGYFRHLGRIDNLIITRGFTLDPTEIENAILRSGVIKECMVTGEDDKEITQRIVACLVPEDAATFDLSGLRQWLATQLSYYKLPHGFDIVTALPRNGNGKLMRKRQAIAAAAPLPRRFSKQHFQPADIHQRHQFLEQHTGVSLAPLFDESLNADTLKGNIENAIGTASVPVGIAGPLHVQGQYASGGFYVPLATTEGSMVASYHRGMKLFNADNPVKTVISGENMQRSPVFCFDSLIDATAFAHWLPSQLPALQQQVSIHSRFAKLRSLDVQPLDRTVFVRFNYTTGDAAGQNMVTIVTEKLCLWLLDRCPWPYRYLLSGNFDTDKKHSALNMISGRGRRVSAEIVVPADALYRVMKTTPEQFMELYWLATKGGWLAGATSNGCHSANGIAALFIALGQDAACVAESSSMIMDCRQTPDGNLRVSITIPSLIVGTVGGGVNQPYAQAGLALLGCQGTGKANKLAEIVAATVLAGELSLACAMASHTWATAHRKHGRITPTTQAS